MAAEFTHLHVHSEFSLLDGMCRVKELVQQTRALGMDSIALTDHGVLYAAIPFYQAAKAAGVKPIIGMEGYITAGDHRSRSPSEKHYNHITLLAKNQQGFKNLIKLTSVAHIEGYYYKPRIDHELLEQHREGLVVLSGCPSGETGRFILQGRMDEAKRVAAYYKDLLGEDFFIELMDHGDEDLEPLIPGLLEVARELDIPLVATNDAHYVHEDDAYAQSLLLCIQTKCTIHDPKRMQFGGQGYYLASPEQMAAKFRDLPDALKNTRAIAERCNLELEFGRLMLPDIEMPAGLSAHEYLEKLCGEGLAERYAAADEAARQRLTYELDVIKTTGFSQYFLVVWDFTRFARERGIMRAVRGSAAGSIVLYCLKITDIDPLSHKLVFERFLNIERKEMPDIDMDFADDRREEVIEYVTQKYGRDHVAQIITFGTLGAKAALRDTGRALGLDFNAIDRVAKQVPALPLNMTIAQAMADNPALKQIYDEDEPMRHLIDTAQKLEGIARHASTHAAGVVIARDPLVENVPLQMTAQGNKDGEVALMTQWPMEDVARVGLLKMDFLGLSNLSTLGRAVELIKATRGEDIDLNDLPQDDAKSFELLGRGDTVGVFQLEGVNMTKYVKELKPTSVSDIAAMIALYRPGPMAHIPRFIQGKRGEIEISYLHPILKPILEETYGIIVYQDQVLFILQAVAGYSLGRADIIRKAMGKKVAEIMRSERQNFLKGAVERGIEESIAAEIFALIEPFAGYAFNKAHSACYAKVAYQTAYLKANYPAEYMAALLTTNLGDTVKAATVMAECRRLGIEVLPPHVNQSALNFTIEDGAIRFGLGAIKNVGRGPVGSLLGVRAEGGEFASLEDFCSRIDLKTINKRVLESMIKAGAMDELGERGTLLAGLDRVVAYAQRQQQLRESGQATMFDLFNVEVPTPAPQLGLTAAEATTPDKLTWEKELLGVALSEHPFQRAVKYFAQAINAYCGQISADMAGQPVKLAGTVTSVRELFTREERKPFCSAILEDLTGSVEVTVWPETYARTREYWKENTILLVAGKVKARNERVQLVCDEITPYSPEEGIGAPPPSEPDPLMTWMSPAPNGASQEAPLANGHGPNGANGASGTNGASQTNGHANGPAAAEEPRPTYYGSDQTFKLRLYLTRTPDAAADEQRLRQVAETLQEFSGQDRVQLDIILPDARVRLEWPDVTTGYCPMLKKRLVQLLGEDGLVVQEVNGSPPRN